MAKQEYRYELTAMPRKDQGKGASRRLRHQGLVPAIVYGGEGEPMSIAINQDELIKNAKNDSFFSQIINLKIEGQEDTEVLVRDVQHHVYKPLFMHFDFQRIVRGQELTATIAFQFINEDTCVGVKTEGGIISHLLTNVDVICRPSALPEFIVVDMANVGIGEVVHMGNIQLPEGVRLAGEWTEEDLEQTAVAQVIHPQVQSDDEESDDAEATDEGEADNKED